MYREDPEITDEDCRIVNGMWENGRCYPKRKHNAKFQVSFRRATGAIERMNGIPSMIVDDVAGILISNGGIYDIQVEGLPYHKFHYLYGGHVKPEVLNESERSFEIHGSRWKSHKHIRGRDIGG
jgi:hypothetical protein